MGKRETLQRQGRRRLHRRYRWSLVAIVLLFLPPSLAHCQSNPAALPVATDTDHESDTHGNFVLRPNQVCETEIVCPADVAAEGVIITASLSRYSDGKVVWLETKKVAARGLENDQSQTHVFQWNSPPDGGVYQFDAVASRQSEQNRWWPKKEVAPKRFLQQSTYVVDTGEMVSSRPADRTPTKRISADLATAKSIEPEQASQSQIIWTAESSIDLSVSSGRWVEAWQTIRHTVRDNSWFEIDLGGEWLKPAIGDQASSDHVGGEAESQAAKTILLSKLSRQSHPAGDRFVLPPQQSYRCDLPAAMNKAHRISIGFDPQKPIHLMARWFRTGAAAPFAEKRIDYVPSVDASEQFVERRYIYLAGGPSYLIIDNLDRTNDACLGSIEIEQADLTPQSILAHSVPSERDSIGETDAKQHVIWIDDNLWNDQAYSAHDEQSDRWTRETKSAALACCFATKLQVVQKLRQPQQIWVSLPPSPSLLVEAGDSQTSRIAIDRSKTIELLQRQVPNLRLVASNAQQASEVPEPFLAMVATILPTDLDCTTKGGVGQSLAVQLPTQSAVQHRVFEQSSAAPLPDASFLESSRLIEKLSFRKRDSFNECVNELVIEDDHHRQQWLNAWQRWTRKDVREFESVDPSNRTVSLHVTKLGEIAIVNHAPWRSAVHLTFQENLETPLSIHGNALLAHQRGSSCKLDLRPGGLAVLTDTPQLRSWSSTISGGIETVNTIKDRVTQVIERVGLLSVPPLEDDLWRSDFTLRSDAAFPADPTDLSPWLHAQHPKGCVIAVFDEVLDLSHPQSSGTVSQAAKIEKSPAASARCVEMTCLPTQNGRTWLVSPMLQPHRDGRLAISLRCRSVEPSNADRKPAVVTASVAETETVSDPTTVKVRISLEGIRSGQPVRRSRTITPTVQEGWRNYPMMLDTDDWDLREFQSLRATVDLLSPGVIRIDDFRVHRHFATIGQQESLQKSAFLAIQGFKRGNLSQSASLLSNIHVDELLFRPEYQPVGASSDDSSGRSLTANPNKRPIWAVRPSTGKDESSSRAANSSNGVDVGDGDHPSVSSRLRQWWPQSLRF